MDWNAVGAIGVWAGAIATTGAVIVALKQSSDATSTKVKVGVSLGFIAQGPSTSEFMVILSATNIGLRTVRLTSAGILLSDRKQLIFPSQSAGALPASLQQSETTQFWVEAQDIAERLKEQGYKGIIKVKIFFTDSHDIKHYKKWKFNVNDWSKKIGRKS